MNIREKIQKIIDKAKSTDSEAEAEMLFAKAHELMERHQIEAFELGDDSDPVGMTVGVTGQSGPSAYRPQVQAMLTRYYGARPIRMWQDSKRYRIEIVGPESARVTTELMTDFVWDQIKAEASKLAAEGHGKRDAMIRKIANAFCARIGLLVAANVDKPRTNVAAGKNSLVVKSAIDAWVATHYEKLIQTKGRGRNTTAAARGAAAGISIHRQTGGAAAALRLGSR